MHIAKIGTLFLVIIMALTSVGMSYASWFETVDINADVTTGELDWEIISIHSINGNGATIVPTGSGDEWTVTISNVYPGWEGTMVVRHKNIGTVPLRFESFRIVDMVDPANLKSLYTLKFYAPDDSVNFGDTLNNLLVRRYYDTEFPGVDQSAFTIAPNSWHDSKIGLELSDTLTGNYNTQITFTFRHWATQAI